MMPWWSWIVIWAGLVFALLAMVIFLAFRLFRKGMAVLAELEKLGSLFESLDGASAIHEPGADQLGAGQPAAVLAVLQPWGAASARRDRVRAESLERREERSSARVARGRALTKVDASTRNWFGSAD